MALRDELENASGSTPLLFPRLAPERFRLGDAVGKKLEVEGAREGGPEAERLPAPGSHRDHVRLPRERRKALARGRACRKRFAHPSAHVHLRRHARDAVQQGQELGALPALTDRPIEAMDLRLPESLSQSLERAVESVAHDGLWEPTISSLRRAFAQFFVCFRLLRGPSERRRCGGQRNRAD